MSRKLKIGGACLNQTPIDWENNISNIKAAIGTAKEEAVDILCLPELCVTGYGCEDLFLSEWLPEKALEKLEEIVPETKGVAVALGVPVRFKELIYNTTCFVADGEVKGFYAKQNLARDGVHYEHRWFNEWESGLTVKFPFMGNEVDFGHVTFQYKDVNIAFEICEDAWRDEGQKVRHWPNVDLILNPSASHFAFKKAKYREELVCNRSREFECTYLYTNLLGNEAGRLIYDGDVLVASQGKLVGRNARLSFEDFRLLTLSIDFDTQETEEQLSPDFENQNEEFTQAASLAFFDYLRKSRSRGYVVSLSGGADSSTIATLVAEMIKRGVERLGISTFKKKLGLELKGEKQNELVHQLLTTAYQGTKNSSKETFESAKHLADSLGATFYSWEIDEQVDAAQRTIEAAIGRKLTWENDDITLQNIQARSRSPIIWMIANLTGALLLATSNRSEGDVGYATMDGDTSGSISPIAGVSKTFILQWLKFAEKKLGYSGLRHVNSLTPTAELRPAEENQTDEEDLMPYEVLKQIELEAVLNGKSPAHIHELLKEVYDENEARTWVRKFFTLWSRNQWKRERYAPSFHFDDFNIDPRSWYRFPILSGSFQDELKSL